MTEKAPELYTLLSAASYLMTRYTLRSTTETAQGVVHHLKLVLDHPEIQASAVTRFTYSSLLHDWENILGRHIRHYDYKPGSAVSH